MKKLVLTLFGIGLTGFLIGGAGLDGPNLTASVILAAAGFVVATVGYRLWAVAERKEAFERAQEERRRKEIEATKETIARTKESTFQVWLESGKLDVPVRG